jgi:hypothetical protein
MPVVIPNNYIWRHWGAPNSVGPSLRDAFQQLATDLAANSTRVAEVQAKLDSLITNYTGHLASAGVHQEADVTNVIAAPVATDVTVDILALLNDEVVKYEAHRVNVTGGIHGAADATNVVTATSPATTEAEAVTLAADLRTQYEAHRVLTAAAVHANPDNTNTIATGAPADWDAMITFCNEFKNTTGFNDHIALTAGPVHGADGSADAVTAADAGTQVTALFLELNEFKTDANAHIASAFVHPNPGTANATAAATDEATSVALINGLKATLNTHIAAADDHQDADTTTTPVAGTATEYEDIIAVAAEWRAAYDAHRVITAVHSKADAANAETVLGTGGAPTVGLTFDTSLET